MRNSDIQGPFKGWTRYCRPIISYYSLGSTAYMSSHDFEYVTSFKIKSKNIIIYRHLRKLWFQHYSHRTSRYKGSGSFQIRTTFNLVIEWRIQLVCRTLNEALSVCTVLFPKNKPGMQLWHSHCHKQWISFSRSKVGRFLKTNSKWYHQTPQCATFHYGNFIRSWRSNDEFTIENWRYHKKNRTNTTKSTTCRHSSTSEDKRSFNRNNNSEGGGENQHQQEYSLSSNITPNPPFHISHK